MSDIEILHEYRDIVMDIYFTREHIEWNRRHGLPVFNMTERVSEMLRLLLRFEEIIDTTPDIKTRNVLCCRYALGMPTEQIAETMGISCPTVDRLRRKGEERLYGYTDRMSV